MLTLFACNANAIAYYRLTIFRLQLMSDGSFLHMCDTMAYFDDISELLTRMASY